MKRVGWGLLLIVLGLTVAYFISGKSQSVRISSVGNGSEDEAIHVHDSTSRGEEQPSLAKKSPASADVAAQDLSSEDSFHGRRLNDAPLATKPRAFAPQNLDKRVLRAYSAFAGTSWKLWVGARARLQGEQLNANAIASVNGYDVFASGNSKSSELLSETDHPVVYDENTKLAGVISGVYILELADNVQAEELTLEDDFQIIGQFSRHLLVKPLHLPFNFVQVFQVLSQDSNFKSVRLEVLGRDYAKF